MIRLYRSSDDSEWQTVRSAIEEACLAYEVVDRSAAPPALDDVAAATVLVDDGEIFRGASEILPHVEELVTLRDRWHKYGSDACYCDDEGNIE